MVTMQCNALVYYYYYYSCEITHSQVRERKRKALVTNPPTPCVSSLISIPPSSPISLCQRLSSCLLILIYLLFYFFFAFLHSKEVELL